MSRFALISLAALGLLASGPVGAQEAPPEPDPACDAKRAVAVAAAVQARYDAIQHWAADFEQSTQSVVLGLEALAGGDTPSEVTRGQVLFSKPGRMRWAYREPEESYVISDGRTLWIYDVAARQATRLPVGEEVLAGAALQFLLGEGRLAESFEIAAAQCGASGVELDLVPKQPASYERLGLIADPESGLVSSASIVDLFGNRTRIRFSNVRQNEAPPEDSFRFAAPKGVEIIEMQSVP